MKKKKKKTTQRAGDLAQLGKCSQSLKPEFDSQNGGGVKKARGWWQRRQGLWDLWVLQFTVLSQF